MTVSTFFSAAFGGDRPQHSGLWQRIRAAFELSGKRRAARQLLQLDDILLARVGLSRAELEETLR